MVVGSGSIAKRRGLRQEIVVKALLALRDRVTEFDEGISDKSGFRAAIESILLEAERDVFAESARPVPQSATTPAYIDTSVFYSLMGIGTFSANDLGNLIDARLAVSAGANDGK